MKKTLSFIFSLVFVFFIESSKSQEPNFQFQKDSLEVKKLQLEVKNLQDNTSYSSTSRLLTILGSFLGLATIIWTIYQGSKTIKNQIYQQTQTRISNLLELLSDSVTEKRASAVSGLSRYPSEIYNEILFALKIEQVEYVREMLEDILLKLPEDKFGSVVEANRGTLISRSKLLGGLGITGEKVETTEALLGIDKDTRIKITSNFRYFFDHGQDTARYQIYRASQLLAISSNVKEGLINEGIQAARVAYSTSKIISKRVLAGYKFIDLSEMDLNLANLYSVKLHSCNFKKSILTNSIFRHAVLTNSNFEDTNLNKSDLYDCNIDDSTIINSSFDNVSLRKSNGSRACFVNSSFENSILSQSVYNNSIFNETIFNKSKIKGTELMDCSFINVKFNEAILEATKFDNSKFEDSSFYKAEMRYTSFVNCELRNIHFNGSELQNANFSNCKLVNVDFSGANLKGIKYDNWKIENCIFNKVKDFDTNAMIRKIEE